MPKFYQLKCFLCHKKHQEKESVTTCLRCGGPLETYYDYKAITPRLNLYALKTAPLSLMILPILFL